jgi:hypothetical protein
MSTRQLTEHRLTQEENSRIDKIVNGLKQKELNTVGEDGSLSDDLLKNLVTAVKLHFTSLDYLMIGVRVSYLDYIVPLFILLLWAVFFMLNEVNIGWILLGMLVCLLVMIKKLIILGKSHVQFIVAMRYVLSNFKESVNE